MKNKSVQIIVKDYDRVIIKEQTPTGFSFLEVAYDVLRDNAPLLVVRDVTYRVLVNENDENARWTSRPLDYVSQSALDEAIKQLNRNMRKVKRLLAEGKNHPAYPYMKFIVSGVVRNFIVDFKYSDTLFLGEHPNEKFLWLPRESGTEIFTYKSEWSKLNLTTSLVQGTPIYFWDTKSFRAVDADEAQEIYKFQMKEKE